MAEKTSDDAHLAWSELGRTGVIRKNALLELNDWAHPDPHAV
jgi:hypothetical protein